MPDTSKIVLYNRAGFSAVWCSTYEPDLAQLEVADALAADGVKVYTWDVLNGLRATRPGLPVPTGDTTDPVAMLAWLGEPDVRKVPEGVTVVAHNLHRLLHPERGSLDVVQAVANVVPTLRSKQRQLVVIVPPGSSLPPELDRAFTLYEHKLPDRDALRGVISTFATETGTTIDNEEAVLDAAQGLTRNEARNSAALSAISNEGRIRASIIVDEKANLVRRNAALELPRYDVRFANIGGLGTLKSFCLRAIRSPLYQGVVLTGPPGTGKSAFAKALGNEVNVATIFFDPGRATGSLLGQTEALMRGVTATVDAFGRCVLFIDELEKGFSGVGGSGQTDGGTIARSFGSFLTWLNDRPRGQCFVVATSNNVAALPPEFLRAGRWDATFFVDLPDATDRAAIFAIHAKKYGITSEKHGTLAGLDVEGWTGAELEQLCTQAAMLDCTLAEAQRYVIPVIRSRGAEVEALREWAKTRAIPASTAVPAGVPYEDLSAAPAPRQKIRQGAVGGSRN